MSAKSDGGAATNKVAYDLKKLLGDLIALPKEAPDQQVCSSGAPDSGDTKWAAAHLNLAPSTLNKMRVFGTGPPFYRLGRAIRYRRRELDDWRDQFRAVSTSEADANLPRSLTRFGTKGSR
jgi:hypothetical protein